MAYDEDHAEILRQMLFDEPNITEKKMFGGLCFLKNGNMVCGVHKGGGMARVGKTAEPEALEIEGISPLSFTGNRWAGWSMCPLTCLTTPFCVAKSSTWH